MKFVEEAKHKFREKMSKQLSPFCDSPCKVNPTAGLLSKAPSIFASLIDNDTRKLQMGFLERDLDLSLPGSLPQDEPPDCQVKIEESQLLCFLTLFTDLLGPISFHLCTA